MATRKPTAAGAGATKPRATSAAAVARRVGTPGRAGGEFDAIDLKILSALRADCRLTTSALAEKVGLSTSPCWTRVKRLEEIGAIENYVAVLNHKVLGLANVVFVEITLDKHDDQVLDRVGEALALIPEVTEAYLVTGDYDYLIKVVVTGTDHYERFLRETLFSIRGIRQSRTTFGLRTLKRAISVDPLQMSSG